MGFCDRMNHIHRKELMYDDLSMGTEAIAIAERYQGNEAGGDRKRKYFEVLVSSNQNAAAAE